MELAWTGFDCGSGDHPMNTTIRYKRPDARAAYEEQIGGDVNDVFPEEDLFVMHRVPFSSGITHVENMGGDIEDALGTALHDRRLPDPDRGRRGLALPPRRLHRRMSDGRRAGQVAGSSSRRPDEPFPGSRGRR